MVLNKRDLERAFSPHKPRKHTELRKNLSKSHKGGNVENTISSNMKVVVRIRPQNERELEKNTRSVTKLLDNNNLLFDPKEDEEGFFFHGTKQNCKDPQKRQNKELEFTFDRVFGCDSSNEDVFEESTKTIVKSLVDGYNCSVFAYGATGAGKTFTMLGSKKSPGITYLTIVELYKRMEALANERQFDLGVSHLEVYNENVQDLIRPSGPLHLREDGSNGVRIPGLTVHRISNADELFTLMAQGNKNRTQHPTDANAESSRSHSVFQLYVRMTSKLNKNMKIMKLSMIDLAGSERGSATGCKGMRFTEGANINKSLLALGNCINSLADGLKHIPYRDSKLTRLLKDSLGGNSQTVMIANVSPSSTSFEDTYNTLKYATRAKKIKQMVKKNIISVQLNTTQYTKMIESLTAEVENLRQKLRMYETNDSCQSSTPATSVSSIITSDQKEKLSVLLQEQKTISETVLKLGKEIKILKFRSHLKLIIADRLPHLSINTILLNKRLNRIRMSLRQLEGRETSFEQKLKEAVVKQKELYGENSRLVKQLDQDDVNSELKQYINDHHVQLELLEKNIQVKHCQQLLLMHQNQLESQDVIIKELCTSLKEYHYLLQGNNKITDTMNLHYDNLVHKLEGIKSISWESDNKAQDVYDLKFNIKSLSELSIQSLCSEDNLKDETLEKIPGNGIVSECAVNSSEQSKTVTTPSILTDTSRNETVTELIVGSIDKNNSMDIDSTTSIEKPSKSGITVVTELIDDEGNDFSSFILMATTLKESLNEIVAESEVDNRRVTEISDRSIINKVDHMFTVDLTTATALDPRMPRLFDETKENCGIVEEHNATPHPVPLTQNNSDTIKTNSGLNSTFVLCKNSTSQIQETVPRILTDKIQPQSNIPSKVIGSGYQLSMSMKNDYSYGQCNKENRFLNMKFKASSITRGGSSNNCKDKTVTVPELPQFRTSRSSTQRMTPLHQRNKQDVRRPELGKVVYVKQRNQLKRAHPYITN